MNERDDHGLLGVLVVTALVLAGIILYYGFIRTMRNKPAARSAAPVSETGLGSISSPEARHSPTSIPAFPGERMSPVQSEPQASPPSSIPMPVLADAPVVHKKRRKNQPIPSP